MSASQGRRRIVDGGADADIGGATTDVAVHGEIDVAIAGLRDSVQQRDRAHHLPRLTIAALRDVAGCPRALHGFGLAPRHTLDRRHVSAANGGNRQRTGAQRPAVDEDRASTALRDAASELGACQTNAVAEHPEQRRIRIHIHRVDAAVHLHVKFWHRTSSPPGAPRRSELGSRWQEGTRRFYTYVPETIGYVMENSAAIC